MSLHRAHIPKFLSALAVATDLLDSGNAERLLAGCDGNVAGCPLCPESESETEQRNLFLNSQLFNASSVGAALTGSTASSASGASRASSASICGSRLSWE